VIQASFTGPVVTPPEANPVVRYVVTVGAQVFPVAASPVPRIVLPLEDTPYLVSVAAENMGGVGPVAARTTMCSSFNRMWHMINLLPYFFFFFFFKFHFHRFLL
jgi:hypothetical protein